MKEIWVYAECKKDDVASSYYELITKAATLSNNLGDTMVCAVVLGNNNSIVSTLKNSGVSKVYSMEHALLEKYNAQSYSVAFASMIEEYKPEMVIVAASALGSELAPTVAGKVKTGLAAHCVDLRIDPNTKRINCMVPAFGGKVISEIYVPNTRPVMASVKPGILEATELESKDASIISCNASCLDSLIVKEEVVGFDEFVSTGQSLESAPFVLSVGRGVNEESYEIVKMISNKLDGTIGYTRSFVDTGMVEDESNLIGTSGKSIKPKVLLEFGISGAVHYISGINKSKCIISVNTDENAKIFSYSDYGVVGDAKSILKELEKKL